MTFQLHGDQIAIDADPIESKTESGLHIPENSGIDNRKPRYGTVVNVGTGRYCDATGETIPLDFVEGQRVFFHRAHDNVLEIENQELLILRTHEIWGVEDTSLKAVQ